MFISHLRPSLQWILLLLNSSVDSTSELMQAEVDSLGCHTQMKKQLGCPSNDNDLRSIHLRYTMMTTWGKTLRMQHSMFFFYRIVVEMMIAGLYVAWHDWVSSRQNSQILQTLQMQKDAALTFNLCMMVSDCLDVSHIRCSPIPISEEKNWYVMASSSNKRYVCVCVWEEELSREGWAGGLKKMYTEMIYEQIQHMICVKVHKMWGEKETSPQNFQPRWHPSMLCRWHTHRVREVGRIPKVLLDLLQMKLNGREES